MTPMVLFGDSKTKMVRPTRGSGATLAGTSPPSSWNGSVATLRMSWSRLAMSRQVRLLSIFAGGGGLRAGLDRWLFAAGAVTPERAVPHDRRHLVGRKLGHR